MTIWSTLSVFIASTTLSFILLGLDPVLLGYWLALGSCVSLLSLCLERSYAAHRKDAFRALVAYQFIGIFLFLLSTIALYRSDFQSFILQAASILLRLGVTVVSISFLQIVSSITRSKRFLFYFSNAAPIVCFASLYFRSPQLNAILSVAVVILAMALSFVSIHEKSGRVVPLSHGTIYVAIEGILRKISGVCEQLIGPIIVEWFFISFVALLWTTLRILSRFFSYASLQRYFATSLLLLLLLLLLVLRP